ncbi:hypothetical protein K443DRAFT_674861 [Laccaria amethystina LaAM-08-1]|uniref:Pinin/SDK/MemA protein domain-containing protein n=1 Tax=Laccaria amethystina LaAM-08-1 TaxID=1095629 RepID=A0A0C9XL68_9AGAR|nr:hypothetical protein K443DRAFT_674861 [Laccaria amethystina LaAM-08-1]
MSTDEAAQNGRQTELEETPKVPTEPAAMAAGNKKRPRLDLNAAAGNRERKRGKSMFGILVGTLNKAKIEDKERNASEAAKKRQLIEQRLQAKLRKETDSVRRAEEAKKDKTIANRREEELQLKDSIYKLRRTRLPILSNFLSTSDVIPSTDSTPTPSENPLAPVPRTHPPPLYYLPAILLPSQEAFIAQRKAEVREAAEKEWDLFREERTTGIDEIAQLRQRVAEEEARRKTERAADKEDAVMDAEPQLEGAASAPTPSLGGPSALPTTREVDMDVDDEAGTKQADQEKKEDSASMQADDDDAVEY